MELQPAGGLHPDHPVTANDQVFHRLLEQPQTRLPFQGASHRLAIEYAVGLRPGGPDGRSLAGIEHPEVDPGPVRRRGYQATERIHLAHQLALADAADRRVATHLAQRFQVMGQQQGPGSATRGRQRRLGTRVSAPYDDDVKVCVRFSHAPVTCHKSRNSTLRVENRAIMLKTPWLL